MDTANAFMLAFMEDYNRRFSVAPRNPDDAHRPVLHREPELALILCLHHTRTRSKNLACQFHNRTYQVQTKGQGYALRKAAITVCEAFDGTVTLLYKGRPLRYRLLQEGASPADEKSVSSVVDQVSRPSPPTSMETCSRSSLAAFPPRRRSAL